MTVNSCYFLLVIHTAAWDASGGISMNIDTIFYPSNIPIFMFSFAATAINFRICGSSRSWLTTVGSGRTMFSLRLC
jgi:hypothetical protein